jgi:hypothetical protein
MMHNHEVLQALPLTKEAYLQGEIMKSALRYVSRIMKPQNEAEWLKMAQSLSLNDLEKEVKQALEEMASAEEDAVCNENDGSSENSRNSENNENSENGENRENGESGENRENGGGRKNSRDTQDITCGEPDYPSEESGEEMQGVMMDFQVSHKLALIWDFALQHFRDREHYSGPASMFVEAMLAGWEFTLYDAAGNELSRGITNSDGKLVFFPVPNGAYLVTETPQEGWENTTPLTRELAINGQCTEVWFGNSRDRGDLEVYKWNDVDKDGVHDGVEDMLAGWEFTLYDSTGAKVSSGITNANGLLVFSDLTPGDYTVVETLQPGWKNTTSLTQHVVVVDDETVSVWFGNVEFMAFTELDLAITKLADDHTVDEGQLVTYTLTYWNLMTEEDAYDYTIVDDYDERYLTIVNANGGTVADGKITWKFPGPLSYEMGKQTLTYTARVSSNMPDKTTYIDNTVVIDDDRDFNYSNNWDDERIVYRPEGEPFLPFTGGEYRLLLGFAVAAAVLGLLLRLRTDSAA